MSEPNNISFDADSNEDRENIDPSSQVAHSRRLMSGSFQVLGNLTHKNNEYIINAIMQQADRKGLIESLGYPNRTVWIRDNIPVWFGTGGILARLVSFFYIFSFVDCHFINPFFNFFDEY